MTYSQDGNVKNAVAPGSRTEQDRKKILEWTKDFLKISPALVMRKMKVGRETAEKICADLLMEQAINFFYFRCFGVMKEEYYNGQKADPVQPR